MDLDTNTRKIIIKDGNEKVTNGNVFKQKSIFNDEPHNIYINHKDFNNNKSITSHKEDKPSLVEPAVEILKLLINEYQKNPAFQRWVKDSISSLAGTLSGAVKKLRSSTKQILIGSGETFYQKEERLKIGTKLPNDALLLGTGLEKQSVYVLLNISQNDDDYKVLGLEKGASQREIKKAYHRLSNKWHPDHKHHPQSHQVFNHITQCYNRIKDDNFTVKK